MRWSRWRWKKSKIPVQNFQDGGRKGILRNQSLVNLHTRQSGNPGDSCGEPPVAILVIWTRKSKYNALQILIEILESDPVNKHDDSWARIVVNQLSIFGFLVNPEWLRCVFPGIFTIARPFQAHLLPLKLVEYGALAMFSSSIVLNRSTRAWYSGGGANSNLATHIGPLILLPFSVIFCCWSASLKSLLPKFAITFLLSKYSKSPSRNIFPHQSQRRLRACHIHFFIALEHGFAQVTAVHC